MTIDKSKLMKRAWEIAKNTKQVKNGTATPNLSHGLVWAWKELKEEMAICLEKENAAKKMTVKSGRYVELLSVAEKTGLNHGKSWVADGYTVDKNSLNPSYEGELVCYVYAA